VHDLIAVLFQSAYPLVLSGVTAEKRPSARVGS
jgi:hypothetical protein